MALGLILSACSLRQKKKKNMAKWQEAMASMNDLLKVLAQVYTEV
jgi:hypothetical protein